jgi:hypothetical protein
MIDIYVDLILTEAAKKPAVSAKAKVVWPTDTKERFCPYIHSVDAYRGGNKYVLLIRALNRGVNDIFLFLRKYI